MGGEVMWCKKMAAAAAEEMGRIPWKWAIPIPVHSLGFQHWEDRSPLPLAVKKKQGLGQWKKLPDFYHLKGQHSHRTYANPPTLGFTTEAAAGRVPVTHGKRVK